MVPPSYGDTGLSAIANGAARPDAASTTARTPRKPRNVTAGGSPRDRPFPAGRVRSRMPFGSSDETTGRAHRGPHLQRGGRAVPRRVPRLARWPPAGGVARARLLAAPGPRPGVRHAPHLGGGQGEGRLRRDPVAEG